MAEHRRSSRETVAFLLVAGVLLLLCALAFCKTREGFTVDACGLDLNDIALSPSPADWDEMEAKCFAGGVPDSVNQSILWDHVFIVLYTATLVVLCAYGGFRARRKATRRLGWSMVYVAVFAAVVDLVENYLLWRALYGPEPSDEHLNALYGTSLAKWVVVFPAAYGLLALLMASSRLLRSGRRPPATSGVPEPPLPPPPPFLDRRYAVRPTPGAVAHRYWRPEAPSSDGVGICLSGGGIRAAAFSLGALQSLQSAGVYERADYLATVSGGGYLGTGSQLVARTSTPPVADPFAADSPEAEHVRQNARYLWPTPTRDPWGAGFVSTASTAVFSILFNVMLATACVFVAAVPIGWGARALLGDRGPRPDGWHIATILVSLALSPILTSIFARWLRRLVGGFARWVLAACLGLAATALMIQLLWRDISWWWFWWGLAAALAAVALGAVAARWRRARSGDGASSRRVTDVIYLLVGPLLGAVALFAWESWYGDAFARGPRGAYSPLFAWWLIGLTLGALVGVEVAQAVRWIWKRTHRDTPTLEPARPWFWIGVAVALVAGVLVIASLVTERLRPVSLTAAAVALLFWAVSMRQFVRGEHPEGVRFSRATIALVGVALVGATSAVALVCVIRADEVEGRILWSVLAAGLLLLYFGVDQKAWSPHGMYKGRLARTFSRRRVDGRTEQVKDTGLSELAPVRDRHPALLICAAAYDTEHCPGEVLAWPFTFAHDFVGGPDIGWCRTADFERSLGRFNRSDATAQAAMAISGAAVSPGLGHIRFGSVNAAIALLNLRLGVWLPAPRYVNQIHELPGWTSDREGPNQRWISWRRFTYLFKEIFSIHDPTDRFLLVTDGGQVDNLGLLELLSRRCRVIVCVDASGDNRRGRPLGTRTLDGVRRLAFERYGIRMAWRGGQDCPVDPGFDVDLSVPFVPNGQLLHDLVTTATESPIDDVARRTARQCTAVLDIHYPEVPPAPGRPKTLPAFTGTLVYGKALLFQDVDSALVTFAAERRGRRFPSDSTGDQWPDHDQFEHYESLGRIVGNLVATAAVEAIGP